MNNSNYNSLTQKLIQSGIISDSESDKNDIQDENFFESAIDENAVDLPIEKIEIPQALQKKSKRLNQSDLEMVSKELDDIQNNSLKLIARFLNIKQNLASKGALGFIENFLFAFFPRLYKAKLVKDAMKKFSELNIDTKKLLDKTIPYGEGEMRYQNLIKYINYANEIQTRIKKEIN